MKDDKQTYIIKICKKGSQQQLEQLVAISNQSTVTSTKQKTEKMKTWTVRLPELD
jgi:hypothetical protein